MKKLINTPDRLVDEELAGMARAHADLIRIEEPNIVVRRDAPRHGKVGIISGGGSGHEPMHGGFVGLGMLDAACPGAVFTSPVPDQMLAATKAVDGGAGLPSSRRTCAMRWKVVKMVRPARAPRMFALVPSGPTSWLRFPVLPKAFPRSKSLFLPVCQST